MSRRRRCVTTFTIVVSAAVLAVSASGVASAALSAPTAPASTARGTGTVARTQTAPVSAAKWQSLQSLQPSALDPAQAFAQQRSSATNVAHLAPQLYTAAGVPGATGAVDGRTAALPDGRVEVTVTGAGSGVALSAVGASVVASADGAVTAVVAPNKLASLAGAPGIDLVQPIRRAYAESAPTGEGLAASMGNTWQANGQQGTGARIAIVDAGFANLADEVAQGDLPANTVVTGNHCADVNGDTHGTAIALIVHQMAPGATLSLYCVDDTVGLAQAGAELQAAGAQIVTCSLGFLTDARGDGTGASTASHTSASVTVARARKAGILWVNAAGNTGEDHWSGTFADRNKNGYADLNGATHESDKVLLPPGSSTDIVLTWDQWPTSSVTANLRVDMIDETSGRTIDYGVGGKEADLPNSPVRIVEAFNSTSAEVVVNVRVSESKNTPAVHYDLSYFGDVSTSYFSELNPARAAAGSITEPASSPYALAVGAAYWANDSVEPYSSRGPTLDGRAKPDLVGYDGVSSKFYGLSSGNYNADIRSPNTGFFGTSAAAPNVAGAAALVKAANPGMDAAQIQAFLDSRAKAATTPASNLVGRGMLSLGAASMIAPQPGSGFTPISPVRVLDTRSGIGGRRGAVGAGELAVGVPASVPSTATAVVINLTGTGATGSTFLSVYPTTFSGTSNLNLGKTDPTAAVSATVALSAAHNFRVHNNGNLTHIVIDVVGFYSPSGDGYAPTAPVRVLDTRTPLGGHFRKAAGNEVVTIKLAAYPQIPPSATAVVVNLTATNMRAAGFVSAAASAFTGTSSLNYSSKFTRANLAVIEVSGRTFRLRNSGQPVDLVADVVGYYSPSAAGRFHPLPSPVRIADTRSGNGGRHAPLTNGAQLNLFAAGLNEVPYSASAIVGGVVAVPSGTGVLTVYPYGQPVPRSSTLNYSTGRVVPNAFITGMGAGVFTVRNAGPAAAVAVDEVGYFSAG